MEDFWGNKQLAHVSQSTGEYEWYTPKEYIESALKLMGSIDTDPASSEYANTDIVKAKQYFTKDTLFEKAKASQLALFSPRSTRLVPYAHETGDAC